MMMYSCQQLVSLCLIVLMSVKCVTVVVFGSLGYETFSDVLEESLC